MAEYIDKEKTVKTLDDIAIESRGVYSIIICSCARAIERIPTADVRPVVKAHWTDHRTIEHDGEWYCSACGKEITIYMGADRKDRYAYCPNCGADMREES